MKKALITGVTGQDGSYLSELLLSKGYEIHGQPRVPVDELLGDPTKAMEKFGWRGRRRASATSWRRWSTAMCVCSRRNWRGRWCASTGSTSDPGDPERELGL